VAVVERGIDQRGAPFDLRVEVLEDLGAAPGGVELPHALEDLAVGSGPHTD
jgi:hypothetical protein